MLLVLLLPLSALAQQKRIIGGVVKDPDGKPISDVTVSLLQSRERKIVIAYTSTDEKGRYSLTYGAGRDSLTLSIGGFNIPLQIKQVSSSTKTLDFVVAVKPFQLKEVSVRAKKITLRGDTLNYHVATFVQPNDHTIEDVLKRMPGIKVNDGGQIKYKGKAVKGVFIEGLDLMKNRYAIATKSISADNIATVQVFENHQDIKALKDLAFIDQATINLKLKKGSKGVLGLAALSSAGWSEGFVGQEELVMTYFARKHQHLGTLKWNNTGLDLGQQLHSFGNDIEEQGGRMTMMIQPTPPNIDREKYLFNNDLSATLNNIFVTPLDHQLSLNVHYLKGNEDRNGKSIHSIFLPNGETLKIEEQLTTHDACDKFGGEVGYKINNDNFFFNDELTYNSMIDHGNGVVTQPDGAVNQIRDDKGHYANNHIDLIYRSSNGRGVRLLSNTRFIQRDEQLGISSSGVKLFGSSSEQPFQTTNNRTISTYNSLHLLQAIKWKDVSFSPFIFANYRQDRLTSDLKLSGFDNLTNNLKLSDTKVGASLETAYNDRNVKVNINIPVGMEFLSLRDAVSKEQPTISDWLFNPSFSLNWKLSNRWNTTLSSSYSVDYSDISTLYSGHILQDYRTIGAYVPQIDKRRTLTGMLRVGYKWVQRMFFADASLFYSHSKSQYLYADEYDGILLRTSSVAMPNTQQQFNYNISISKGVYWKRLNISLSGGQSISKSPYLIQKQFEYLWSLQSQGNLEMSIMPVSRLMIEYNSAFSSFKNLSRTGKNLILWTNKLGGTVEILRNLFLNASGYHQYNNQGNNSQHTLLVDASMSYKLKGVHLSLEWNNICNTQYFYYRNLKSDRQFESRYKIRPSSVMLKVRFKIL